MKKPLLIVAILLLLACHASHAGNSARSMMRDSSSDDAASFGDFMSGLSHIYPGLVQYLQATQPGADILNQTFNYETTLAQAAGEAGLAWTILKLLCPQNVTSITCQCWRAPAQEQTVSPDTNHLEGCRPIHFICNS